MPWVAIAAAIAERTGRAFRIRDRTPVAGGSIHAAYRLSDGERAYFVKLNRSAQLPLFEAEADGLQGLAAAEAVRVPEVIAIGVAADRAYLVLEWLDLHGRGDWAALGAALAAVHQHRGPRYGWQQDNFIGATPQPNGFGDDWPEFFAERRLGWQLTLAAQRSAPRALIDRGRRLQQCLPALFSAYWPAPSLLHGDLWGGNLAFDEQGRPVLYDPAVHYGDRESDLAMSELFGRLPEPFYRAYGAAYPLDPGYAVRRLLYQLYHVLNHFNLFGGGYAAQAGGLIDRLLAELGG